MKFVVRPYRVINQEVWLVDSLVYDTSDQSVDFKISEVDNINRRHVNITALDGEMSYNYIELTSISAETRVITSAFTDRQS